MCEVALKTKEKLKEVEKALKGLEIMEDVGTIEDPDDPMGTFLKHSKPKEIEMPSETLKNLFELFNYLGSKIRKDINKLDYGVLEAFNGAERDNLEAAIWSGVCNIEDIPNRLAHSVTVNRRHLLDRIFFFPKTPVF